MLGRAKKLSFFLIVFFISSQVGYHFWPSFSYINGIRIDYISPTLYLLDILMIVWIVLNLKELRKIRIKGLSVIAALFLLGLIFNMFAARSVASHMFGIIKLVEFILFGYLVATTFKQEYIPGFVRVLSLSSILSFILAVSQFLAKGSVGGLWYYFGERTFGISTIGISTVNFDQQILRPYASFPHPNLLAFFFLITVVFSFLRVKYETGIWKYTLLISILLSSIGVVLTFSRISILLLVSYLIYEIYTKVSPKFKFFGLGVAQILVPFFLVFIYANFSTYLLRGIDFRQELFLQSFSIFSASPYFGIGLNNFFIWQEQLIKTISPTNFQPPHNIFLVALLSLGIFGWWIFLYAFYQGLVNVIMKIRKTTGVARDFYVSILICLVGVIVVGSFDHFFLTLEQGQIMFALILGLTFTNLNSIILKNGKNR